VSWGSGCAAAGPQTPWPADMDTCIPGELDTNLTLMQKYQVN
jgi:hypothetical protein